MGSTDEESVLARALSEFGWYLTNDSLFGPMLVVDGEPSADMSLERALSFGASVNVVKPPHSARALGILDELLRSSEDVAIATHRYADANFLEHAPRLRRLSFEVEPSRTPNFRGAPLIEDFSGVASPRWCHLREVTGLRRLRLDKGDFSWVEGAPWKLRALNFTHARRVTEVPRLEQLSGLTKLCLHGCVMLDLSAVGQMDTLRVIELATVRQLRLPASWAPGFPGTGYINLERIKEIENPDSLRRAPFKEIILEQKRPFTPEFIDSVRSSTSPRWVGGPFGRSRESRYSAEG